MGAEDRFACFLQERLDVLPPTPYLREVLGFEHALVRAALYGERSRLKWDVDPTELFETLEQGRVPAKVRSQELTMEIVPG